MVALTLVAGETLTPERLKQLYKLCFDALPNYAQPLFVRVVKDTTETTTFKQQKFQLREEGYDLARVHDPLYYRDTANQTYSPITTQVLQTFLKSKL